MTASLTQVLLVTVLQGDKASSRWLIWLIAEPSAWVYSIWASLLQGGLKELAMEVSHLKIQNLKSCRRPLSPTPRVVL